MDAELLETIGNFKLTCASCVGSPLATISLIQPIITHFIPFEVLIYYFQVSLTSF